MQSAAGGAEVAKATTLGLQPRLMAWVPGSFIKSRAYLCAASCSFALGHGCTTQRVASDDLQGLAALLGQAASASVGLDAIAWEPSSGTVWDALWGRRVLFLAKPKGQAANDVFRARVRVSSEGQAISVQQVSNLTETDLGHETALQLAGDHAVFASVALGELQGVTALDLRGLRAGRRHGSWLNRQLLRLRAWQTTGSASGLGRVHLGIAGVSQVRLRLDASRLFLATGSDDYAVDLESETFLEKGAQPGSASEYSPTHSRDDRVVLTAQHQGSDSWLHTLVDVVREELGAYSVAWLEDVTFSAQDDVRRRIYGWSRAHSPLVVAPPAASTAPARRLAPQATSTWPPPSIASIWRQPKTVSVSEAAPSVEGSWLDFPPASGGGPADEGASASALFKWTFVYPDSERPYAKLNLVAMDMRRLELRMQGGFEEPRPKTGPPGRGSLPDEPETLRRVAATFNGAFKSLHGDYGMMVDRRVLVPPKPHAASIVVRQDNRVGFGDWSSDPRIDEDIVSFRQNLDALVSEGKVNPKERRHWGEHLTGHSTLTERSALCLSHEGNLYYGYGADLTALSLANGMQQAGCRYAVHLDMNPGHTGFFFVDAPSGKKEELSSVPAFQGMSVNPKKYALWSEKDFFYVLRRSSRPTLGGLTWRASVGTQPEPGDPPGLFESTMNLGTLAIRLFLADANRVSYRLTGGAEPLIEDRPSPRRRLPTDEQPRVLFALTLGHTTLPTRYGLSFGKRATLPLRKVYGTLVLSTEKGLEMIPSGQRLMPEEGRDYVQLPELVKDGSLTAHASQRGAKRARGAVCVQSGGTLLVALASHDSSDAVGLALSKLGCAHVLELDRASKHDSELSRAGTSAAPREEYETTTLHGLGQPMQPWTFRLNPE